MDSNRRLLAVALGALVLCGVWIATRSGSAEIVLKLDEDVKQRRRRELRAARDRRRRAASDLTQIRRHLRDSKARRRMAKMETVRRLADGLNSSNASIRRSSANRLAGLVAEDPLLNLSPALRAIEAGLSDHDSDVRAACVLLVGASESLMSGLWPVLIQILSDSQESTTVRAMAARVLGKTANRSRVRSSLEAALACRHPAVRIEAAGGLVQVGSEQALRFLLGNLSSRRHHATIIDALISAGVRSKRVRSKVALFLNSENALARASATLVIANTQGPSAIEASRIADIALTPGFPIDLRLRATQYLGRPDVQDRETLSELSRASNTRLRATALAAIEATNEQDRSNGSPSRSR